VALGAVTSGVDFTLDRAAIVVGKVTNQAGQPAPGVTVNLYQRTGNGIFVGSATTIRRGWYMIFMVNDGSYTAYTSNSQGYVNEIFDNIACPTICSTSAAVTSGTPITVAAGSRFSTLTFVNFSLETRNAAPGAPTNLRATASGSGVTFTWTPPTPSTTGIPVSYVIDGGATPGGTLVSIPAGSGTSHTVPAVPSGVFYIRVRAINAAGSSPASNEVTLTMTPSGAPPDAPTNVQAFMNDRTLTFTWVAAVTGGAPTSYVVEAGSAFGSANLATVPVTGRSFTYTPVPDGSYFLRVRAINAAGASAPSADVMIVVGSVTPPPGPPNFTSSPVSGNTVTLNWTAPAFGTATSYLIEAGSAPGLSNLASANTANANTTISFSGVPRGTYYVRIRAVNAQGASLPSNERTVTVQ
jgi:predicted phage tail protein